MSTEVNDTDKNKPVFNIDQIITSDADPTLIWEAMTSRASQCRVSDIHLLAQHDQYNLFFRIDGDMAYQGSIDHAVARHLINHVKSLAGMDIAERRRPTEGRMKVDVDDRTIDLRISVIATVHGLDMVVRLFDHEVSLLDLNELGMLDDQLEHIYDMLSRPNGLILVSGPTGSGKTTTLYAMLRHLAGNSRKIMTIEDPVEYDLPGVNQSQINPRIDVTFAGMLTSIMRQDPDIIMVGEIRDKETALTAVRAANMGHLVLATTHATRATQAVETLLSLGVHPFFLGLALRGVIAQVLVKTICENCKEPMPDTADMLLDEKIRKHLPEGITPQLYQGRGCDKCFNTGYKGRMGIFEQFIPDEKIKKMINERKSAAEIEEVFRKQKWLSIEQAGKYAAVTGKTTMEEIVGALPFV